MKAHTKLHEFVPEFATVVYYFNSTTPTHYLIRISETIGACFIENLQLVRLIASLWLDLRIKFVAAVAQLGEQ
jgi:hypothetical protein